MSKVIKIRPETYAILEAEKAKQDRSFAWLVDKSVRALYVEVYQGNPEVTQEKKPNKNPQLKRSKPEHPEFKQFKDLYLEAYQTWNGFKFLDWGVIQAQAMNSIISKCKETVSESGGDAVSFWQAILIGMPQFFKGKSLHAINNNLSGIITEIRTGGRSGQPVSSKYDWRT